MICSLSKYTGSEHLFFEDITGSKRDFREARIEQIKLIDGSTYIQNLGYNKFDSDIDLNCKLTSEQHELLLSFLYDSERMTLTTDKGYFYGMLTEVDDSTDNISIKFIPSDYATDKITYYIILRASGYDDLELPASSLQYSLDRELTTSITVSIPDISLSEDINDRLTDGEVIVYYYKDETYTELCRADIERCDSDFGGASQSLSVTAKSTDSSFTVSPSEIILDDIISYYGINSGNYTARPFDINEYYVPGTTVSIDSVQWYIGSVSVNISESSSSIQITEGAQPDEDNGGGGDCLENAVVDDPAIESALNEDCSWGIHSFTENGDPVFYLYYQKYFQFTLAAQQEINIEISGYTDTCPDMYLVETAYSKTCYCFVNCTYNFLVEFSDDGTITATLPAGTYTAIVCRDYSEGDTDFDFSITS